MKKNKMTKIFGILIFALLISSFTTKVFSKTVELKGFKLGMTKKEFKKTWKSQRKLHSAFHYITTLAGVKVDKPKVDWTKKPKQTYAIQFQFYYSISATFLCTDEASCPNIIQPASNFVRVVEAIKRKYPGFECSETNLMNKMGAEFINRECIYNHGDGVSISTNRYHGNEQMGTITILPTQDLINAKKQSEKTFNNDL